VHAFKKIIGFEVVQAQAWQLVSIPSQLSILGQKQLLVV
jgi:hypothetical protein